MSLTATDGYIGQELWISDGTVQGTSFIDIYPPSTSFLEGTPGPQAVLNGVSYFAATDRNKGRELWRSDGTIEGTYLVKDITSSGSSNPQDLAVVGDRVFFRACPSRTYESWCMLWVTDGTEIGTVMLQGSQGGEVLGASGFVDLNGIALFRTSGMGSQDGLWRSDGTKQGTYFVKEIMPVSSLTAMGDHIYFNVTDSIHGTELWKSDGMSERHPDGSRYLAWTGSSNPTDLAALGSTLLFSAKKDGVNGSQLWKTDGTESGTVMVKNILPIDITPAGNSVYFKAEDATYGLELWKSDGTEAGTVVVADIAPGLSSSDPSQLINADGILYFRDTDVVHGSKLWKSDGTAAGTVPVGDSFAHSPPQKLTVSGDKLYFTADDGVTGPELWAVKIDRAPTVLDDTASTDEEEPVSVAVLTNDSDLNGDTISITALGATAHGTANTNGTTVSYTPTLNFHGTDIFTYTVSDGMFSRTAKITLTVNSVNDPPVAVNDTASTDEDLPVSIPVLANDSDLDGDILTVTALGATAHGTANTDGSTVSYTPTLNFHGTDVFTYTVSDGTLTSSATVTVTVSPINDPPVAVNDTASTDEDRPVSISVLANDSDLDGNALSIAATGSPAHGKVSVLADGRLRYTPNADYFGAERFTYRISDSQGGQATAEVVLTITPVADAPHATDDRVPLDEDGSARFDVRGNDVEPDGEALILEQLTSPAHGTLTLESDGSFLYHPQADFFGEDSFTYSLSDGTAVQPGDRDPAGRGGQRRADRGAAAARHPGGRGTRRHARRGRPRRRPADLHPRSPPRSRRAGAWHRRQLHLYAGDRYFDGTDGFTYTRSAMANRWRPAADR